MTAESITDFSIWDRRVNFTAHEVAYLWLNLQPRYKDHPDNITSFVMTLSESKLRSELLLTGDIGRRFYTDSYGKRMEMWTQESPDYERQSLRAWAERIGQRPLFLFPEDRNPINPADNEDINVDNLHPKSEATLLKILDATLSMHYGNDWLDGDIETIKAVFIKDLAFKGLKIPAENRALTRWITKMAEKRR